MIPDDSRFREFWTGGIPVAKIASEYGVSRHTVYSAARRYGMPLRDAKGRVIRHRRAALVAAVQTCRDHRADRVAGPRPTDFWTPDRDARLLASGGGYAAISALAVEWGVASTKVMARWHLLRAVV